MITNTSKFSHYTMNNVQRLSRNNLYTHHILCSKQYGRLGWYRLNNQLFSLLGPDKNTDRGLRPAGYTHVDGNQRSRLIIECGKYIENLVQCRSCDRK